MKMTSNHNRGYNATRWIDAKVKKKQQAVEVYDKGGGDLRETRREGAVLN
jgi:hypothetical protein